MAKGGNKNPKGKVRYDGLDVTAMVAHLNRTLLGRRIINIYDGVSDSDAFIIKFDGDGGKTMLFLESGIRFHTTNHQSSLQQEGFPTPFCSKLRKHLRGLRLEKIAQLGNHDRVVNFIFGTGQSRKCMVLELYSRGNLLLTTSDYEIMALLRSHEYDQVVVKVGQIYPVTYATSLGNTSEGLLSKTAEDAVAWAKGELEQFQTAQSTENAKKKKSDSAIPLKAFLLKPSSGVYHYGPSLLEHCILFAGLDPNTKVCLNTINDALSLNDWTRLIEALKEEGAQRMKSLAHDDSKGFILYRPKENMTNESKEDDENLIANGLAHTDKVLQEFQPQLLKQHQDQLVLEYDSFANAVDDFFAHIGGQRQAQRAVAAETAAKTKLDKIRKDQEQRVESLQKEQEKLKEHAQIVEAHAEDVDKALSVINSALNTGMDWEALEQLVEVEQENRNPIALLISKLDLENDSMVLCLPNVMADEEEESNAPTSKVLISLQESAHGNAREMFAKYRAFKEKSAKTLEASTKALKAAEANAQRQLAEAQKKSKLTTTIQAARKPLWFEKFHWFVTSDNYLVLGGRDAHQNEMLVKRYLRAGDAYLHADVHGAASCILRAKRQRKKSGKTETVPLSDQALREAGSFTICRSSAWASKMVTSAWWVESSQVSKTAPTGEYLTVGSFMVRGKKNFLPPSQLEMGLAVLFKLGDDDSIARHKTERRDFAIMNSLDDADESENELSDLKLPTEVKPSTEHQVSNDEGASDSQLDARPDEDNCTTLVDSIKDNEIGSDNGEHTKHTSSIRGVVSPPEHKFQVENGAPIVPIDSTFDSVGEDSKKKGTKKGLSVKERKMIKKYGSLEAAQKATEEREQAELEALQKTPSPSSQQSLRAPSQAHAQLKRGKKGKLKKLARKYADQDEEDRELALLALHGGEKQSAKSSKSADQAPISEIQEKAAAETKAYLIKDASEIADTLDDDLKNVLEECVTVSGGAEDSTGGIIRWDKFDSDVLEQLKSLDSHEQQLAAVNRLLSLKQTTRVDNFSSSLAGIIRTIKKFGHEKVASLTSEAEKSGRKTKADIQKEKEEWKETMAAEGITDTDKEDGEDIDDTAELSKLTGKPLPEDALLYAVPVCAPYQTLSQYKYRVKLTPGNGKRGKAAKQCVEMFAKDYGDKSRHSSRNRELIKRVGDNDWVQVMCSDVKISAAGASKAAKKQKGGKKGGKR